MPANRPSRLAILFALLVFLLPACTQPAPSATFTLPPTGTDTPVPTATDTPAPTATRPRPKPSSTKTIGPTTTPWPTNTSRPSPTVPTLAPSSARLAYLTQLENGRRAITFMNADGSNRSVVEIPEDVVLMCQYYWSSECKDIRRNISPDGQWLAFYTGLDEDEHRVFTGIPTLKLMHLPDSEIITVTALLSPDYPENFTRLASYILENDPEWREDQALFSSKDKALSAIVSALSETFANGLGSLSWSPDSRYLAFAGQMTGDSSDVYRYEVKTGDIIQLTNGFHNIQLIKWAPSGPWIAHTATIRVGAGMNDYYYAVRSDGSRVVEMGIKGQGKWLNSHVYLINYNANGPGDFDLSAVDVETGAVRSLWRDSFHSYAFDPRNGNMLISNNGLRRCIDPGIYLLGLDNEQKQIQAPEAIWDITFRGGGRHDFVALSTFESVNKLIGLSEEGISDSIASSVERVFISPDLRWMLLSSSKGIELYDENDILVRTLTTIEPEAVFWRPDSLGFFFITENRLYYIDVPDGNPMLIDSQVAAHEKWEADLIFTWLR